MKSVSHIKNYDYYIISAITLLYVQRGSYQLLLGGDGGRKFHRLLYEGGDF